ncbi:polyketide cyclase [Chromatiales bacterium (ex Bugula neritina AB1)]|nr:polyketide cyclase [Chromatiales bacterium (ex Bugula neritina AB1)]
MHGFESRWKDFPAFIIGITREIWEDRGVARLHDYYAPDLIFRMASGIGQGNKHVIAATLATLAEFPDRELLAEDVIWCGTPEKGMLSSHRVYCQATHTGHGEFGAATGKPVCFRAIADCHARANRIDDEWLVRDRSAICTQLGLNPSDYARTLSKKPFTPDQDRPGPYTGKGNDHAAGQELSDTLTRMMSADITVVRDRYDRACSTHQPGGYSARSYAAVEKFWIGLRASFPSAEFQVDHQIGRDDNGLGRRAAVRWSLRGSHDGWGSYGPPTGAEVYIMGFTHVDFGPWGVRSEYTLFDEVAIWQQIFQHTG